MTVRLFCLLIITSCLLAPSLSASLTVSAKSGVINQNSDYFFLISDTAWSLSGSVQLVFESPPYSFTNTTGITTCYDPNTITALNCIASSSSTISFNWDPNMISGYTQTGVTLQFYLQLTLINPPYVDTFTVTYNFIRSGSVYSTLSGKVSGLYSDSLSACSLSFSPSYTNSYSVVTVGFTTKNNIPAGGSFQLVVNNYASSDASPTLNVLNNGSILNGSVVGSSSGQNYFFSKFFSSAVAAGSVISFSLSKLTTPPTTQTSYFNFYLASIYTTNYLNTIDNVTCTINSISDYPIANLITVLTSSLYVGNTISISIDFTAPILMSFSTDKIAISTDTTNTKYITVSTLPVGFATTNATTGSLNTQNTTNGMEIINGTTQTIASGVATKISSGVRVKAIMNSGVKNIFVQFFRSGYSYANGTCTVTVSPNSLYSVSINPVTSVVSQNTTYEFTARIKNGLGVGAAMKITLPSDLWIANGACTVSISSSLGGSLSTSPTCTASSNSVINVGNITSSTMTTNATITVSISNIQNPISTKPTSSFLVQTYYSSTELTDPVDDSTSLTGLTVTATSNVITTSSFSISRNNQINLKNAVYTITYKVNTRFKANGYITLSLPTAVTLSSAPNVAYTLTYPNTTVTSSQTITATSSVINSTNVITFNFSNFVTVDLSSGVTFTISVTSILNYPSLKPIYPQISTYTSDSYLIEYSAAGALTLTNTAQDTSLSVASTTSTRINGKSTTYTLQLTSPTSVASGSLLTVQLQQTNNINTQMYLSSSVSCQVGGVAASCTADSVNTRMLKITTAAVISANSAFIVSISNIILSRSFDQPGSIYFRLFEVSAGTNYNITSSTLVPAINTNTNAVISSSLTINDNGGTYPSQLNQVQTFDITLTTTNRLQSGDIVVITIPSEYLFILNSTVGNATFTSGSLCTASSNLYCSNNNSSPNIIRIVEKTVGSVFTNISSLTITINNNTYRSPQSWTTYNSNPYLVNTYSISSQAVDSAQSTTSNATFYLTCTNSSAHCKTCSSGLCTACYKIGDGYDTTFGYGGYFYLTSTGQCVTTCGNNFYNQSNTCQMCTSPCYSCSGTGTFCNSCVNSTYKLYNNTCLTGCPNGYYSDSSNVCQACSSNCYSCSLTSTSCTSCNGNYLSAVTSSCVAASGCASYTYADSSTYTCTNCSVSCVGCTINSTMCKTCSTGYIINTAYNSNGSYPAQCTNQCPSGTANDTTNSLGLGVGCRCNTSACATCTGTINTCLTCQSGLYLLNTACVSSCGSGYYISSGVCTSCPSGCSGCSSSSICTGCSSSSYWIYQGYCVNACPTYTSYAVSGGTPTCITCSNGCTACQTSTYCTACLSSTYIDSDSSGNQFCTSTCSNGKYVMGSRCSTTCDSGYTAVGSVCQSTSNNTSSSTITTSLTSTSSRIIPFPVTIGLAILTITAFASKIALTYTIFCAALAAFSGLMEVISWLIFIIAVSVDSSDYPIAKYGLYIVLCALVVNWILNAISLYFFKKYIWTDDRFQSHLKRLRNKTKTGACVTYCCLVITGVFSHKFLQILFSNLFEAGYFVYKVEDKLKLTPLNYIRYVSLLPSVLALVGAAIANFQYQSLSLGNLVFMQSIDLLLVTILAAVACLWATVRKSDDYENSIADRHEIEEQLGHDPVGDQVNQFQKETFKVNRDNNSKKYIRSSIMGYSGDSKDNPLTKHKGTGRSPTGEEFNITNAALDGQKDNDQRIDISGHTRRKDSLQINDIDILQDSGDDRIPSKIESKINSNRPPKIPANIRNQHTHGSPQNQRYVRNQQVNDLQSTEKQREKQKLKSNIEGTLTQDEIEKTKVIKEVDKINTQILKQNGDDTLNGSETNIKHKDKNEVKKQKLQTLSEVDQQHLSKLPDGQRQKAGEIKTAMSFLQAKKINIREYLQYLDIIQEEEEDQNQNSQDYERRPPKPQKGQFKGKGKAKAKGKPRPDRTHKKVDQSLVINNSVDQVNFDDDMQPQIPDLMTSIRNRNRTQSGDNSEAQDYRRRTDMRKSLNNRSDLLNKNQSNFDDLVLVSMESGENYDRSLAEEFQKGNALHPVDRDQLPPPNLYSTEKMQKGQKKMNTTAQISNNRIVPNTLIADDHIDFVQSQGADQQTIRNDLQFNQDISPSQFNQPNMRINNDQVSEAPTKPRMVKKSFMPKGGAGQVLQVEDIEDEEPDEFNHEYDNNDMPAGTRVNRYNSSRMLDYDQILYNKRQNEKMKQLQQIYLPRLDVLKNNTGKRKRNNQSTNSDRRKEDR